MAAAAVLAPLAVASIAPASAAVIPGFTATVTPTSVASGSTTLFTITVGTSSPTAKVGSFNVIPPSGFTLSAPSVGKVGLLGVLRVRNVTVPPTGLALTVTGKAPTLATPCSATTASWTFKARGSGDFDAEDTRSPKTAVAQVSPSPAVTITSLCDLVFTAGPTNAVVNTLITSTPFAPGATPVTVGVVLDGTTTPVATSDPITLTASGVTGATLSGAGPAPQVAGVASFAGLALDTPGTYTLGAATSNAFILPATSGSFTIEGQTTACVAGTACSATATLPTQSATLSGTSGSAASISIFLESPTISCTNQTLGAPFQTTWSSTGFTGTTKQVVVTIDSPADTNPAHYSVCYSQPDPWLSPDNISTPVTGGAPALLGSCDNDNDPGASEAGEAAQGEFAPPCVNSIAFDGTNIVETVTVSASDPHMR